MDRQYRVESDGDWGIAYSSWMPWEVMEDLKTRRMIATVATLNVGILKPDIKLRTFRVQTVSNVQLTKYLINVERVR